ncbi:cobalt ABC transporter ATPase, partial [Clostridium botulinum C str. Stockholm]
RSGEPVEIFSDSEFLQNTYLEKPLILDLYERLIKNGFIGTNDNIPRNKEELFNILNNKKLS